MVEILLPFDPRPGLRMFMTEFFTESVLVVLAMSLTLFHTSHRSLMVAALLVSQQQSMASAITRHNVWDLVQPV